MISKYPGTCCYCSKPTLAGKDEYDLDSKKSYHVKCEENRPPDPADFATAERLGFIQYHPDMDVNGLLRSMSPRDRNRPAEPIRGDDAPRREQSSLWAMSASDED